MLLRSLLLGSAPFQQLLSSTLAPAAASRLQSAAGQVQQGLHQHQQRQRYAAATTADSLASHPTNDSSSEGLEQLSDLQEQQQGAEVVAAGQQQEQQQLPAQQPLRLPGPILPTHIILQAVRDWQGAPPTKHDLYAKVTQEYAGLFPTMNQFNAHLRHIVNNKWVATRKGTLEAAAAAASAAQQQQRQQPKKGSKKAKGSPVVPFVYVATAMGRRVDVCSPGSPLQQAARRLADEWTAKRLPSYISQLQAGRIPVTPDNVQLLGGEAGLERFRQQQAAATEQRQRRLQRKQQQQRGPAVAAGSAAAAAAARQ